MEEQESLSYKASLSFELKMVDTEAKFHSVMKMHEGQNIRIAYSGGSELGLSYVAFSALWLQCKGSFL